MEVHAHTHTPRKKWTHYFWEFLMLFLAVFCGFLAENYREHQVERKRGKQYIYSLIQDIKTDTANITGWLNQYQEIKSACDTLLVLRNFEIFMKFNTMPLGIRFGRILDGFPDFIYTDKTIQQFKNAGGLRLISNIKVTDSIIAYDGAVRDLIIEETFVGKHFDQIYDIANKIFSFRKFTLSRIKGELANDNNNFWLTRDPLQFDQLYNLIFQYKLRIKGFMNILQDLKEQGGRLIVFLEKEYHLDNIK